MEEISSLLDMTLKVFISWGLTMKKLLYLNMVFLVEAIRPLQYWSIAFLSVVGQKQ